VFAVAGGAEKVARCRELGADVVIDHTVEDVAQVVLRETGGRGVDVVFDNVGEAVFEASITATAYNGRYVMMGFASNKEVADVPWVVPRRILLANIKLCGVLLAYADDDTRALVKTAMGWNFLSGEQGTEIMQAIVDLVEQGALHPVVGDVVGFDDIPRAVTALADRRTTGRTVVMLQH
jgi:NADPH2:quinone reductase